AIGRRPFHLIRTRRVRRALLAIIRLPNYSIIQFSALCWRPYNRTLDGGFMIRGACLSLVITGVFAAGPAFAQDGAAIYARACVSCHEQGAVARAPSREVISALSVERIVGALETGTMRTQGEALTPAERRAVATFLSRGSASAPPSTHDCTSPGAALRPGQ